MRNLKIKIAYRGTKYHGFQYQENAYTIQEALEEVFSKVLNEKITVFGCSRTDTGVHANEYILNVKTNSSITVRGFTRGCNDNLPNDISVISCEEADEDFHARYHCVGKEYIYKIHANESKDPFAADLSLHYRRPFNTELVNTAAQKFVGTIDFASFCSNAKEKDNTTRTIHWFDVKRVGDEVTMSICGNGFLYNMIRILVGTLLQVNEGRISIDELDEILALRDRKRAGATARACGLYLNRVFYSEEEIRKE